MPARWRAGVVALALAVLPAAPAASAPKGKKPFFKASSEVEIEDYARPTGQQHPFFVTGGVYSPRKGCRLDRDVIFTLVDGAGNEMLIKTKSVFDPTEPEGFWSVNTAPVPPGSYTARAQVLKRVSAKGVCKYDASPPLPFTAA